MAVTSTTLAGVNVWRFSGAVTDAEIKTAWSALIVNNRYKPARTIYIDDTCSLANVRGTYYVDAENLGIILHLSRNKANTLFRNWFFTQTVGLSVGARSNFVRFTNGTTITNSVVDGIDMQGGGMMYAVVGNPGGGDPRYLNEMIFGSLDGTLVTSTAFTEQEIEPTSIGTIWKGLNIQKAAGYPILAATTGLLRHVIYRSNFNTEGASLRLVRPYYNNSLCYVSSTIRRQGAVVTAKLMDTFGSSGSAVIMVLNNYTDETWFGASKTALTGANWNAGNRVIGGVMKKIQVQPSTLIRTYDSRSTTVSQKSTFSETTNDFLSGTDSTTSNASTGRASIVCVGAIATGSSINITRYTGQKFTLQKFGYKVQVENPDMTFGDDDLSAYSPITMTEQLGIVRTQAQIQAATAVTAFREVLEELHNLAITLSGISSYAAPFEGNFFSLDGRTLNTDFDSIVIDPSASQKIAYNQATNTLTIKSAIISASTSVNEWRNLNGTFSFVNSELKGVFADADGSRVNVLNLDPENFGVTWHLRYRKQAVGATPASAWTNLSGTGNSTTILAEIATYDVMIRVPGYDWKTIEIDTNETLSLDASLDYHVSANNTPQYTMSYDEDLEAAINFDYATNSVSIVNTTGAIINPGFAEFYQATQRIQHIPALVWIWESPVTANSTSQKILIPTGNAISFFLTEDSNASVKATCLVIHQASGQSADDRVKGNASGYSIILGSPATAESAGLQSAIVSDLMEKLGGAGYAVGTDSLKKIKDELNAVKTKVDTLENTDLSEVALEATSQSIKSTVEATQTFDSDELMPTIYAIQSQQNVIIYDQGDMIKAIQSANENFNPVTDSLSAISDAVDLVKAKVDTLENYNDTTLSEKVAEVKTILNSVKAIVEDKTGYSLTTAGIESIATAVESHLLDEGDSQKLIEAIVGAIGNANIDEMVLVAAIRADLERAGGKMDAIETSVDLIENYDDSTLVAKINAIKAVVDGIENYDDATLIAKVNAIKTELDALENYNDTALIAKVDAIKTVVDALENYNDAPTQAKLDAIKSVVDALENTDISGLPSATEVKEILRPLLALMNEGIKKASKLKTHKTNLPE